MCEIGMLAKSKAGHDKDKVYIIIDIQGEYVYLADGRLKTICNPKKKKLKHVQLICRAHELSRADDVEIRKILKDYSKTEE